MNAYKKIIICTEGLTEVKFIQEILAPYLKGNNVNVDIKPTIINTSRVKDGPNFRGGTVKYHKFKKEMKNYLQDTTTTLVTTMFDYYELPPDYPRRNDKFTNSRIHVAKIEREIEHDIQDPRFIMYLQLHEFESLLFSAPDVIEKEMNRGKQDGNMISIASQFANPEEINTNNPPKMRIKNIYTTYKETINGINIVSDVGLGNMLLKCQNFRTWVEKLETHLKNT